MKSLISEVIKIELLTEVLSEGRVENAKLKYPNDTAVVDEFVAGDPSGNNKYLMWLMGMYTKYRLTPSRILDAVTVFHNNTQKFQKKDINQYKEWAEFYNEVQPIEHKVKTEMESKRIEDLETQKLYESRDWLLVRPLSHKSSCKYGAGTQWCTTQKDNSGYFDSYFKKNLLVYLINKPSNDKFAILYQPVENMFSIYNPIDDDIITHSGSWRGISDFIKKLVSGDVEKLLNIGKHGTIEPTDGWAISIKEPWGDNTFTGYNIHTLRDRLIGNIQDKIKIKGRVTIPQLAELFDRLGFDLNPKTLPPTRMGDQGYTITHKKTGKVVASGYNVRTLPVNTETGYKRVLAELYNELSWEELRDLFLQGMPEGSNIYINHKKIKSIPTGVFNELMDLFSTEKRDIITKDESVKIVNVLKNVVKNYRLEKLQSLKEIISKIKPSKELESIIYRCQNEKDIYYCLDQRGMYRQYVTYGKSRRLLRTLLNSLGLDINVYDYVKLYLEINGKIQ